MATFHLKAYFSNLEAATELSKVQHEHKGLLSQIQCGSTVAT